MSAIFLPRKWRHQPQGAVEVDQSHPIGAKVRWAYTPWIGRTSVAPGKIRDVTASLTADPALQTTPSGIGTRLLADSSTTRVTFSTSGLSDYGGSMFLFVENFDFRSTNTGLYVGMAGTSGGDGLQISGEASGRYPSLRLYSSNDRYAATSLSVQEGRNKIGVSQVDSQNVRFNVDGTYETSFNAGAYTMGWPAYLKFSKAHGTVLLFLRADYLSAAEMTALMEEPWAIFRAPSRRIWFDVGANSGTTYNDSLTESATLGDGLDPIASFFASYAESVTAGDTAANAQTHAAAVAESVTPADSATTAQSHAETLAEGVTAGDSAASAQTMPASVGEGVTTGDSVAGDVVPAGSFIETIAESATAEDAYASAQAHTEDLSESLGLADSYAVTGGTEVVERRRGAPIGPPLRTWRYAARIGGRMVYADTRQALQAAIADFEASVPSRAEKKAQKAGKVVVRRLPKVQVVEAPAEERIEVQAQARAANDRIAAEYLSALQAQIAIRAAMERDDMEAMIALDFL